MVSVNFQNNLKVYQTGGIQKTQTAPFSDAKTEETKAPAFKAAAYTSAATVRTSLTTHDEKQKYKELTEEDYPKRMS